MGRSETAILSLEEAKGRFEEWRTNRRAKARIPAELWSAAVEVARKEGINRTARELHVAWDDLERRMATAGKVPLQPGSPAFVELVARACNGGQADAATEHGEDSRRAGDSYCGSNAG